MQKRIQLGNLTQNVLNEKFQQVPGLKADIMLIMDNKGVNVEELIKGGGGASIQATFELVINTPDIPVELPADEVEKPEVKKKEAVEAFKVFPGERKGLK